MYRGFLEKDVGNSNIEHKIHLHLRSVTFLTVGLYFCAEHHGGVTQRYHVILKLGNE